MDRDENFGGSRGLTDDDVRIPMENTVTLISLLGILQPDYLSPDVLRDSRFSAAARNAFPEEACIAD